jgi:hypothetical protein
VARFSNKEEYEKWKAERLAISKDSAPEGKGDEPRKTEEKKTEKKCPYCAMMIPMESRICPHCRKNQPSMAIAGIALAIIVVFILIYFVGNFIDNSAKSSSPYRPSDIEACAYSREMVKVFLKAPATAEFPSDACNARVQGTTVSISSYVDSQNGFGAKLRTPYAWTGRYDSTAKKWAVDYFALGNKIVIADGKPASP